MWYQWYANVVSLLMSLVVCGNVAYGFSESQMVCVSVSCDLWHGISVIMLHVVSMSILLLVAVIMSC